MLTETKNKQASDYKSLSRKLIPGIILFSSLITLIITSYTLYERYRYDISQIDARFEQIENVHFSSLVNNLWLADKSEMQVQVEGILKIPDIQYLKVYNNDKLWVSVGLKKDSKIRVKKFPMLYTYKEKTINIGSLVVGASLDNVYQNIYQGLWVTLGGNAVKTFLVAFFMYFLFYKFVIRHLHKISKSVTRFDIDQSVGGVVLDRLNKHYDTKDELDLVVDAFNELQSELKRSFASIEQKVKDRTQELKISKEEAEAANNAKSEFLSSMSHELRTPLNAILGFSQLLEMDDLSQSQKDSIKEIIVAGKHLLDLVNEILDLARIESGKIDLDIQPINLFRLCKESIKIVQSLLNDHDIKIECDLHNDGMVVLGDETRLKQIMLNLLSNAIKYNKSGGAVKLSYSLTNHGAVIVSIEDTGLGISQEKLSEIFEPFHRIEPKNTHIQGTGIGLTITRDLVEKMGGKIGVESNLGKGSKFWFELPVSTEFSSDDIGSNRKFSIKPKLIDGRVYRVILYIEDELSNIKFMLKLFEKYPEYHLIIAETASSGVHAAREHVPDLILLDINLGGQSGFDVQKELRVDRTTREIPIIALSANAMSHDIEKAENAGFADYVTKPIDVSRLFESINAVLKNLPDENISLK